jgi:hypothetical protein
MKYERKSDLMGAPIDDELVLLHVDRGEYFSLKGAGPELWSRLETPHSLGELVGWACETFRVTNDQAMVDIEAFLSSLLAIDAIHIVEH